MFVYAHAVACLFLKMFFASTASQTELVTESRGETSRRRSAVGYVCLILVLLAGVCLPQLANASSATGAYLGQPIGGGFVLPYGVAVDSYGNVYMTDTNTSSVKEIPAGCYSSACVKTLGGGFSAPEGVAVSSDGSVLYVADTYNNAVREFSSGCTSSSCVSTLGTGFSSPNGIAIDSGGNVYVADTNNNAVKKMSPGCLSSGCITTLGTGFTTPLAVAVDSAGNVYVTTYRAATVQKMTPGCQSSNCITSLGGGFTNPSGIALDSSGNIYVADAGSSLVHEMPVACASSSCVVTIGGGFNSPRGLVLDHNGNLYVTDEFNSAVREVEVSGVNFGSVSVGTSNTKTLTFTVYSGGSIFEVEPLIQGGTGPEYTDLGTGTCTTNQSSSNSAPHNYSVNGTCTVTVNFTPQYAGLHKGGLQILSNNNGGGYVTSIGSASMSGTAVGPQLVINAPLTETTLGGGFNSPNGIAVDGGGNVIVSDGSYSLKQMPAGCNSSSCVTSIGGGLSVTAGFVEDGLGNFYNGNTEKPFNCTLFGCLITTGTSTGVGGVALDSSGIIYITDNNNGLLKKFSPICNSSGCVTTVVGGFLFPQGVVVDTNGNIWVADAGNAVVKKVPAGCTQTACVISIAGFNGPDGMAVDANGDVYVADENNGAVKEIPNGCTSTSCVITLSSAIKYPTAIALDDSGNIYVTDTYHNLVAELSRTTAPTFTYAQRTDLNTLDTIDGPKSVTVTNIGNEGLTLDVPTTGNLNAAFPSGFVNDASSTCTQLTSSSYAGLLAAGASCTYAIDFKPTSNGTNSGNVVLTDSNLNVDQTMQTIAVVSGQGPPPAATTTISTSPTGLSFSVDGTSYTTTQTPTWNNGTTHVLTTTSPQSGPGTIYTFSNWADGTTTLTDNVTASATTTSYTADFNTQYLLSVSAGVGGSATPVTTGSSYYSSGTNVSIVATPDPGYYFSGWTGSGDVFVPVFASTALIMNSPETITANFTPIPTYVVQTLADDSLTPNAANCPGASCSLADAITEANNNGGGLGYPANITFASTLSGTITLTASLPEITTQITITGPAAASGNTIAISGANQYQIFLFSAGGSPTGYMVFNLSNLTIENGQATNGGGLYSFDNISAPYVNLTNVTFIGNIATYAGGAIYSTSGADTLTNCTFISNDGSGAGIYLLNNVNLNVSYSTFSGNGGVAILNQNNNAQVIISNSTFSGNGGVIYNQSSHNTTGSVTLTNNIFAANHFGIYDISQFVNANNNLYYGDSCGQCLTDTNHINGNANLSALGNYGGLTQTLLPLPGSAAICAATSTVPTGTTTDQRGYPQSTTYGSTTCYDLGAAQTNYAINFSAQQPTDVKATHYITPAPQVTITEQGNTASAATSSVSIADADTDLTSSPATVSAASGVASFSTLAFTNIETADTLTATLQVTPAIAVTATSTTFNVTTNVVPVKATQAIASTQLTQGNITTSFIPVTGSGGVGTLSYSVSPALPSGLTLSSSTGAITGTPSVTSSAAIYTVTVTDGNSATSTATFSLTVNSAVTATQVVASTTLTQNRAAITFTPVTGANGTGTLSYSVSPALPSGLSISSTTGAVTGTSSVASSSTTYTVTVTDANGATATAAFTLKVNAAVTATQAVASTTLTQNFATTSFTPVTGANGTGTLSYSISPTLPTGLSLASSTGAITGTTSVTGSATTYTVTVTDANGATATATFSLTVSAAVTATQAVASTTLTQNHAATAFTPVTGANGTGTLSYGVSPSLPSGLSFSSTTGAVSGTASVVSALTSYTVTVTDHNGATATATFSLTVDSAVVATQIVPSTTLTQNHATTALTPVTGSGGDGTLTYGVSPTLPTGLSYSSTTGAISGTPAVVSATTAYTVTVTDINSATATQIFILTIDSAVVATKSIATTTLTQSHAATTFTPVTGSGGDGTLTYAVSPTLPTGLSYSTVTGAITGAATTSSSATTYTVTVTDINGATATATFSLTVNGSVTATTAVASTALTQNRAAISFTPVTASGGTDTLSYGVSPSLPNGLSYSTVTGAITGAPTVASTATTYTVTATDTNGATATATFSLTVNSAVAATTAVATTTLTENAAASFTPVTGAGGTGTLSYGVSPTLPTGLSYSTTTGAITGTPTVTSTPTTYTVTVSDTNSATSTATFSLTILVGPTTATVSAVSTPYGSTSGVVVTATEAGSAGVVTGGVVTFGTTGSVGGSFNPTTCTLVAAGTCTSTYTPSGTLTAGAYTNNITVSFAATGNYAAATGATTLTVTKVTPSVALVSSVNPVLVTNPITFTATVTGVTSPTGSVNFLDGSTVIGSGNLSSGVATLSTSSLSATTHTITAAYTGDTNFVSATSSSVSEVVDDISLTLSGGSGGTVPPVTVNPGGTAVITFTASPQGASTFPSTVTFSASGLPTGATYVFSPATLTSGSGSQQVTLSISIPQTAELMMPMRFRGNSNYGNTTLATFIPPNTQHSGVRQSARNMAIFTLALFLLPFAGKLRRSSKRLARMLSILLMVMAGLSATLGLTGCGAADSGFSVRSPKSYTITITGTSGVLTRSTTITLTVE